MRASTRDGLSRHTGCSSGPESCPRSGPGTRIEASVALSARASAGSFQPGLPSACCSSSTSRRARDVRTRGTRGRSCPAVPGIGMAIAAAGALALPLALEMRIKKPAQPLAEAWKDVSVKPRGTTLLGISFRTPQVEAFGLEGPAILQRLLAYPFQLIRLGAYWGRIESQAGEFNTSELDWQIEAAERASKQIILAVGAVKTFGYPEFFVPRHWLEQPLREGSLVQPAANAGLLS